MVLGFKRTCKVLPSFVCGFLATIDGASLSAAVGAKQNYYYYYYYSYYCLNRHCLSKHCSCEHW